MPSFQSGSGFFAGGGPPPLFRNLVNGAVYKMRSDERCIMFQITASPIATATVWLPSVQPGAIVDIIFAGTVTALTLRDSLGRVIANPTPTTSDNGTHQLRFSSQGWLWWL